MSFLPSMPKASLLDVFKAYPDLAAPIHEFAEALMRGPSPFSEGERELIALAFHADARSDRLAASS